MSFASEVKTELCSELPPNPCCRRAELYGILLFGRAFSQKTLCLRTEHEGAAELFARLVSEQYGLSPVMRRAHAMVSVEAGTEADFARVREDFGYRPATVSYRLNRAVLENECCAPVFLRGAFLACGSVVGPDKDYHLEFASPHAGMGAGLLALLRELGFEPGTAERGGSLVVYFKDSGQIEDLLTLMGAPMKSLELMNVKVLKDFRNKANRVTNCETANIGRTAGAAAREIEAIRKIEAEGGLSSLPEELRGLALLRLEGPELTLRELGTRLGISRSGVYHRMRRILALSGFEPDVREKM